jgi:hypothetical protein
MFRKLLAAVAVVPMTLLMAGVRADDAELTIDVASITDADAAVVEAGTDVDVEQLTADAGKEQGLESGKAENAIEACFRSFGYGGGYRGYHNWGGCYNSCYSSYSCYQPCYSSFYYVRPVYHCAYVAAPICSYYWGCY